jgi:hypothetical protein
VQYHYSVEIARRIGPYRMVESEINGHRVEYQSLPASSIGDTLDGRRDSGEARLSEVVDTMVSVLTRWRGVPDAVVMWSLAHGNNEWYASDWSQVDRATQVVQSLLTKPRS